MRKFMRLLSVVLILALVPLFGFTVSAKRTSTKEDAVEMLTKLNILLLNENNDDFSPDKEVTKGEFCLYLSRALKIVPDENSVLPFEDVTADDMLAPYVQALYDMDVIHGYENKLQLEEGITYNQAVKMMVSALGYGAVAKQSGGYPTGYLSVASDLEITKNVTIARNQCLTKSDAAWLIFNMLSAELLEMKEISGSSASYVKSNETALSKLYNIYEGKGRIEANSLASLTSANVSLDAGRVMIGSDLYYAGETEAEALLGYEVDFWYQYDENSDSSTILHLQKDSQAEAFYIRSEDIISCDGSRYMYFDEDGGTRTARLSDDFLVLYNMKYPQSGFSASMMTPQTGGVRLIKGNSSAFDVVMIDDVTSYAVNSVDADREIIYKKNREMTTLTGVDYTILTASGKRTNIEAIKEWSIVSEGWSSDKSSVVIYVSNNLVSGSASDLDIGGGKVVISGEEYSLTSDCHNLELLSLGKAADFYLDFQGRVAAVDIQLDEGLNYGYVLKATVEELDEIAVLKLFNAKGEIVRIRLAEKPRINETRYTDHYTIADNLNGLSEKLIKYELNSDNEISNIFIYDSTSKDYIHKMQNGKAVWNTKQRSFGGKVTVEENVPVFIIPANAEAEDYEVKALSSFANDTEYNVSVYTTGDNIYGEVIIYDTSVKKYQRNAAIVTDVKHFVDENGEIGYKVEVLQKGSRATFELHRPEVLGSVDEGDVVKISVNNKNRIDGFLLVYDKSANALCVSNPYEPQTGAGYRSRDRMYMGYAYVCKDGLLKFHKDMPTDDTLYTTDTENALLSSFSAIYVIDTQETRTKDSVYVGNENDIVDFLHGRSRCSKVIISTNWADPEEIIVIK